MRGRRSRRRRSLAVRGVPGVHDSVDGRVSLGGAAGARSGHAHGSQPGRGGEAARRSWSRTGRITRSSTTWRAPSKSCAPRSCGSAQPRRASRGHGRDRVVARRGTAGRQSEGPRRVRQRALRGDGRRVGSGDDSSAASIARSGAQAVGGRGHRPRAARRGRRPSAWRSARRERAADRSARRARAPRRRSPRWRSSSTSPRIERLQRIRKEFLDDFSHEVRTPLAGLKSAAETLQHRDGLTREHEAQLRSVMERQIARIERLVNDLSELNRIETGRARAAEAAARTCAPCCASCATTSRNGAARCASR